MDAIDTNWCNECQRQYDGIDYRTFCSQQCCNIYERRNRLPLTTFSECSSESEVSALIYHDILEPADYAPPPPVDSWSAAKDRVANWRKDIPPGASGAPSTHKEPSVRLPGRPSCLALGKCPASSLLDTQVDFHSRTPRSRPLATPASRSRSRAANDNSLPSLVSGPSASSPHSVSTRNGFRAFGSRRSSLLGSVASSLRPKAVPDVVSSFSSSSSDERQRHKIITHPHQKRAHAGDFTVVACAYEDHDLFFPSTWKRREPSTVRQSDVHPAYSSRGRKPLRDH